MDARALITGPKAIKKQLERTLLGLLKPKQSMKFNELKAKNCTIARLMMSLLLITTC